MSSVYRDRGQDVKRKYVIGVGDVVTPLKRYSRFYPVFANRVGTVAQVIQATSGCLISVKFWDAPDDPCHFMDFDFKRIAKAKHDPDPTTLPEG